MGILLFVLVLSGALLALIAGVVALRAWLSFRRTRLDLQSRLSEDVARLALRTGELEESLAALDARTQQLPVSVSSLQENLDALRILTGALAGSLRQAQRVLSYSALKTFSATRIADLF
ncbi:MAG: hypothetical protein WA982_02590, partial [Rubrobacteraceae bacterium]